MPYVPSREKSSEGGPQVAASEEEGGLEQGVLGLWQVCGDALVTSACL